MGIQLGLNMFTNTPRGTVLSREAVDKIFEAHIKDNLLADIARVKKAFGKKDPRRGRIIAEIHESIRELRRYNPEERYVFVSVLMQLELAGGANEMMARYVLPFAKEAPGRDMLEIGFGDGGFIKYFLGWEYRGVEISEYAIFQARRKGRRLLKTTQGARLPVKDGEVDYVFSNNTIHEIPNWKYELDEIVRILSDGGRVSVVERTDVGDLWLPNVRKGDRSYNTPDTVAGYLSDKGLETEVEKFRGTYFGEFVRPDGQFGFTHIKAVKHQVQ